MGKKSRFPSPFAVSRTRYKNAFCASMVVFTRQGIGLETSISDISSFFDVAKSTARRWAKDAHDLGWLKSSKRYVGSSGRWQWVFNLDGDMSLDFGALVGNQIRLAENMKLLGVS